MKRKFKRFSCIALSVILACILVPAGAFNASASNFLLGDIVKFGSYPQTKVMEPSLISVLNEQTLGSDNTVIYDGCRYMRVFFTQYRGSSGEDWSSYQDENGYYINTVYWFRFDPIQWRVLSDTNDELYMMSETILDSQPYNQEYASTTWDTCTLRTWLGNDFYNTAFSQNEKAQVLTSTVDSGYAYGPPEGVTTYDKVYLLSYYEMNFGGWDEPVLGFSTDLTRTARGSDYAKCAGLYVEGEGEYSGNSYWRLRTPFYDSEMNGCFYSGCVSFMGTEAVLSSDINGTEVGIRPVIKCDLSISNTKSLITFDASSGTGNTGRFWMEKGSALQAPTVVRTGYTFAGWDPVLTNVVPETDTIYTAQWQAILYKTGFDTNTGEVPITQYLPYDSLISIPEATRPGYTLAEWLPAIPERVPACDSEYVARWYKDGVSINLNLDIGRYNTDHEFVPTEILYPGDTVVVRIKPEADFLAGATRYVVMFDKSVFEIVGQNKDAFTPNMENDFYSAVAPDYTATTSIPDSEWPNTFGTEENYTQYSAVAVGNRANSDSTNQGYPDYLLGNEWLFEFTLQVIANPEVTGGTARIWMDERWVRDSSNTAGLSYFAKCLPGQRSSQGDSVSFDYHVDTTGADCYQQVENIFPLSTISFNMNGGTGTVPGAQTGLHGSVAALPAQGDIARQYYTFLGWAENADAVQALSSYNFPAADATLYAVWQRVPVTLAKWPSSTTVFASEAGVNYIYGLEEGLSEQAFRSSFAQVNGDGRLQLTLIEGSFGTGTRIDFYDNVTNALLKTYWIVIFGDVDGDGYVTAADENLIDAAASYQSEFEYGTAAFYAADIMQDGGVDALDLNIISAATSYTGIIDQVNPGSLI